MDVEGIGGPGRVRTVDLFHAMEARSQLRHRPNEQLFFEDNISADDCGYRECCYDLRFNRRDLLTHGAVGATIIRLAFIHFHLLLLST